MAETENLGKRKRRKKGNLAQLRGVLWMSLLELESLAASDDPELKVKACNSLAALSRAYLACLEVANIETRLAMLEERVQHVQPHTNGVLH
jgi:hypothetical protein